VEQGNHESILKSRQNENVYGAKVLLVTWWGSATVVVEAEMMFWFLNSY
jgi:hypothetical protein